MFFEILGVVALVIFAIDSFMFIGLYGKITEFVERFDDYASNFDEEEESEEDVQIRENIKKTLYA